MKTVGWSLYSFRSTSVSLFLLLSSLVSVNAGILAPREPAAYTAPQGKPLTADSLLSFGKKFTSEILNLNYATAQKLSVSIPGLDQNIVLDWGFGGSGFIFSPLPWIPVKVIAQASTNVGDFTLADLGKALVQDKITHEAKHLDMLRWLTDSKLSPVKVFCLKLFLLVKDYQRGVVTIEQTRTEVFRLITRLGLSENPGLTDKTKPFSYYLPETIKDFIKTYAPEVLEIVDTWWVVIFSDNKTGKGILAPENFPRTVYACPFAAENTATLYMESIKRYPVDVFINGIDIQEFSGVSKSSIPHNMPKELYAASHQLSTPHGYFSAKSSDGKYWVAYSSDRLGLSDTLKLVTTALLYTTKDYARARNQYLTQNPVNAIEEKAAWDKLQKHQLRIEAFLQSEEGKASVQRLSKKLEIQDSSNKTSDDTKTQQISTKSVTTRKEIADLKAKIELLTNKIEALKASQEKASEQIQRILAPRIQALTEEQAAAQEALKSKELEFESYHVHNAQEQTTPTAHDQEADISGAELEKLVQDLVAQGEEIPADIAALMAKNKKSETHSSGASEQKTEARSYFATLEYTAQAYTQEADYLRNELAQRKEQIDNASTFAKKTMLLHFTSLIKPRYEAYIQDLEDKTHDLMQQHTKAAELIAYRDMLASANRAELAPELLEEIKALEAEVGWIVDNRTNAGVIATLFTQNAELKMLLKDLSSDNELYKPIRERLFNTLSLIIKKSDHIKEFASTYRYMIDKSMPLFVPIFQEALNS